MDESSEEPAYSLYLRQENSEDNFIINVTTTEDGHLKLLDEHRDGEAQYETGKRVFPVSPSEVENISQKSPNKGLETKFDSRNYKNRGFSLVNFERLNDVTMISGEVTPHTEDSAVGTQAAHFDSGQDNKIIANITLDSDLSQHTLSLAIDELEGTENIQVIFQNTDESDSLIGRVRVDGDGRFQRVDVAWQSKSKNATLSNPGNLQIRSDSDKSNFVIDDIRAIPQPELDKPRVCFTFDDSLTSHYTEAFPIMREYGYCGTVYTITGEIGSAGSLSLSEMNEMYDYGWEFASHTVSHEPLTDQSYPEVESEIGNSKRWLRENGFRRGSNHFSPPYRSYDEEILDIAMDYYYTSTGSQEAGCVGQRFASTGLLHRFHGDNKDNVKNIIEILVDEDIPANLAILTYHALGKEDWISTSDFEEIVEHVAEHDIEVITVDELWQHWLAG